MKNRKSTILFHSLIATALVISSCRDASIMLYEPKNQDEKEIISLLIEYQDAKNHLDVQRLLSLLHDKGEFTFACGQMVSKTKLKTLLPGLWTEIRSGNSGVIPIVHECINGDYYKAGQLNSPQIIVENGTAEATVKYTNGFCRLPLYFSMRRENHRWMITRTEWGQN